jgi:HNH endonuclease/NUMOD4 motif
MPTTKPSEPEIWAVIPSIPTHEVSTHGRVRRIEASRNWVAGKLLATRLDRKGYRCVDIEDRTRLVHSFVCESFNGPRQPGQVCRHLNDDKTDFRPDNLAWGTQADNVADAKRNGRQGGNPRRFDLEEAKRLRRIGLNDREIAYFLKVSHAAIGMGLKGMPSSREFIREHLEGLNG